MPADRVLVDAGPLIAWFSANDRHHRACVRTLKRHRGPLYTAWPAVTEAQHLLSASGDAQDALLKLIEGASLIPLELGTEEIPRIRELMRKYRDLPMDFSDAVLVSIAERENISTVFTVDRDFAHYRPRHAHAFRLLPKHAEG